MPAVDTSFMTMLPTGVPGQYTSYGPGLGGGGGGVVALPVARTGSTNPSLGRCADRPVGRVSLARVSQKRPKRSPKAVTFKFTPLIDTWIGPPAATKKLDVLEAVGVAVNCTPVLGTVVGRVTSNDRSRNPGNGYGPGKVTMGPLEVPPIGL